MEPRIRRKPVSSEIEYETLSDVNLIQSASRTSKDLNSFANSRLIQKPNNDDDNNQSGDETKSTPANTYASWGIHWRKPTFIMSMLFAGFGLSLAHHFYYRSLNNQRTGDQTRQAWPTRIGTGLAFLVASCLRAATTVALGQYIWAVVKRRPLTLASLDKLFALSTDPTAFFSRDLFKGARVALLLGLLVWLLGLAAVAPPATLTVVAKNVTQDVFVPVLDFSLPIWNQSEPGTWNSQLETNSIAADSAAEMDVVALGRQVYASDWSYDLQFFGPSLQCHEPNSTEQVMFDNVTQWFEDENVFTFTDKNDTTSNDTFSIKSGELLYTSWSYWLASHTPNYLNPEPFTRVQSFYPQIWIQTSTSSIVCDSVNASFDPRIAYVDGVQTITQKSIQSLGNYDLDWVTVTDQEASTVTIVNGTITGFSRDGGSSEVQWNPYLNHVYALGGVLSGNITLTNDINSNDASDPQYQNYGITSVLTTGLMACDEIANSPFKDVSSIITNNPVQTFTNTFPSEPWMCRNGTLMKALEDLANNITIGYLSSPDLTNDNTTLRTIVTSNTYNIYQYHPFYLFLSYGLALLLSFIAALIGFYSLYLNGVSHSNSFSAIIATTRNSELDLLSTRSSLGADPRKVDLQYTRLKFGPLLNPIDELRNKGEMHSHVTEEVPHVAFGFEDNVGKLRKGALYI